MNIGEVRKAKEVRGLEPFLDDLSWGDEEIQLLGSGGLKAQQYPSDYDLFVALKGAERDADDDLLYKRLQGILKRTERNGDMFLIEVKIQNQDESKTRFYEPFFSYKQFERAVRELDYIKVDYVVWVEEYGKLAELSIIFSFGKEPPKSQLMKDIKADYDELKKEGSTYKALKRLFSIYKLTGSTNGMVLLTTLFNSNTGALYSLLSNIKAIKLLLEHRPVEKGVGRYIQANLSEIEGRTGRNIEGIKQLDAEEKRLEERIEDETKKWVKDHNFKLPP